MANLILIDKETGERIVPHTMWVSIRDECYRRDFISKGRVI